MVLYYYFKEQSFSLQTLQTHDIIYIYIYMGNANECLKGLVKNPIKESFDIIFMENEKSR